MKNRRFPHPAACFFLLTVLAAFTSWVGTVYEWAGVRSLLGDEGFRWTLRAVGGLYLHSPLLPAALVLFLGCGLWRHSGLGGACLAAFGKKRLLARKERRALASAGAVAGVYVCLVLLAAWGPWGAASSAVGTFRGSPLAEGLWCVLSLGIALPSVVYGFASDTYFTDRDVVDGMAWLFVRKADFFVTLFFVLLFFASIDYTGLAAYAGISSEALEWVCLGCCLLALW